MSSIEERLRAWAKGIYPVEAGVDLLIRQGRFVYAGAPWISDHHGSDLATLDAEVLAEESGAFSGSEQRIARIAASLIAGRPINLFGDLPGLDRTNLNLVLAAIAHAGGSHEHSEAVLDPNGRPVSFQRVGTLHPWPSETDHR